MVFFILIHVQTQKKSEVLLVLWSKTRIPAKFFFKVSFFRHSLGAGFESSPFPSLRQRQMPLIRHQDLNIPISLISHIWWFPEIGVLPVIIHLWDFPWNKPSSYWGIPIDGNPHMALHKLEMVISPWKSGMLIWIRIHNICGMTMANIPCFDPGTCVPCNARHFICSLAAHILVCISLIGLWY